MKTLYINIFGSPGSGKSTFAAELFSVMKKTCGNLTIEYVNEFAKQFCFDDRKNPIFDNPLNQLYIGVNQFYNIYRLDGKIDVVITDSPFMMSCIYNNSPLLSFHYDAMVKNIFCNYENLNVMLKLQNFDYQQSGRNESKSESLQLEKRLIDLLDKNSIPYIETRDCKKIIELAINKIKCLD